MSMSHENVDRFEDIRRQAFLGESDETVRWETSGGSQEEVIRHLEPFADNFPKCFDGLDIEGQVALVRQARHAINAKKEGRFMLSVKLDVVAQAVRGCCQALINCPNELVVGEIEKLLGRLGRVYLDFLTPEVEEQLEIGVKRCLDNPNLVATTLKMIGHLASLSYDHAKCFQPFLVRIFDAAMDGGKDTSIASNKLTVCNPGLFAFAQCVKFLARDGGLPLASIFQRIVAYLSDTHAHCVVRGCITVIAHIIEANAPGTLPALLEANVLGTIHTYLRTGDQFLENSVMKLIMYAYSNGPQYTESIRNVFDPLNMIIAKCSVDFLPARTLAWNCLAVMVTSDNSCFVEVRKQGLIAFAMKDILDHPYREILARLKFLWASLIRYDSGDKYDFDVPTLVRDCLSAVTHDNQELTYHSLTILQTLLDHLVALSLTDTLFKPAWDEMDGTRIMTSIATEHDNNDILQLADYLCQNTAVN